MNKEHLQKFKEYFDEMYGEGLDIANWHFNGDLEPFDYFYNSAMEYAKEENMERGCEYCKDEDDILSSDLEVIDDIFITFSKDDDTFTSKYIKGFYETERLRVFYDRGYLRLTKGDDIGCLDHSEDRIKANYCINCGKKLQ